MEQIKGTISQYAQMPFKALALSYAWIQQADPVESERSFSVSGIWPGMRDSGKREIYWRDTEIDRHSRGRIR